MPAPGDAWRCRALAVSAGCHPAPSRSGTAIQNWPSVFPLRHAEYVGPNFAEEARKIHYGETPDRHIYGEATHKEAQELVDEGVDVAPLPPDVEGAN